MAIRLKIMRDGKRNRLIEQFAGPSLEKIEEHTDNIARMCKWRTEYDLNWNEMRRRRRILLETRNIQLIESDVAEFALTWEQHKTRLDVLAHAAEVERRMDPETRDAGYVSRKLIEDMPDLSWSPEPEPQNEPSDTIKFVSRRPPAERTSFFQSARTTHTARTAKRPLQPVQSEHFRGRQMRAFEPLDVS